jgi:hypothetical protein
MIDETNKIIYVDYSTLSTFLACKEKCRLGNVIGWRPPVTKLSLAFGSAFHAAWEAYYDALAGGSRDDNGQWHSFPQDDKDITPTQRAKAAFLRSLGLSNAEIPVSLDSEERRSVERGLALVDAYIYRWRAEPYDNILDSEGRPLVEVGFRYYLTTLGDYELWYTGYIDRIMRNRVSTRPVMFEGKTTTSSIKQYVHQCKPNHQITGYFPAAQKLFPDLKECVWDMVFISDRRPDLKKAVLDKDRFFMWGIDVENDFGRQTTTRSVTDVSDFRIEIEEIALDYAKYLTSNKARWPRTAPGACNAYGGCMFKNRCSINLDSEQEEGFMSSFFQINKWEPWRKIMSRAPISLETISNE